MPVVVQPRTLNVRKTVFVASVLILFFVYTYFIRDPAGPSNPVLRGSTMGTTYEVKLVESTLSRGELVELGAAIDALLVEVNRQMSTYQPDSEISLFNQSTDTNVFSISGGFARVAAAAVELSRDTQGAFDPTLGPLIDLWGFGSRGAAEVPPSPEQVAAARARTGVEQLTISDSSIRKSNPAIQLNLSAIAKGYGVDLLADLLAEQGLTNSYVEIGGEVRVHGHTLTGGPWRIGIDSPIDNSVAGEDVAIVLALTDHAIATSGDYRNYFEDDSGMRRSHLIDPRTGMPIGHRLASVSVIASDCMQADGIATALAVLGPEAGLEWVNARPDLEALFIVRTEEGAFKTIPSSGFDTLLHRPP